MIDVFDIALDKYTDFQRFEQMATEVMSKSGYPHIVKFGGYKDGGVDAKDSATYHDGTKVDLIFQFTTQEDTESKIEDTVIKLNKNKIAWSQLVYVTSRSVRTVQGIRERFRIKYKKTLEIFERSTFINILSNDKLLLDRYFPNLRAQIDSDFFSRRVFSENTSDLLDISMMKCSVMYSLNPQLQQSSQRKGLFDKTILSIVASTEKGMAVGEILNAFSNKFQKLENEDQVKASLDRLIKNNVARKEGDVYKATNKTRRAIQDAITEINGRTDRFIEDVIDQTRKLLPNPVISKEDEAQMAYNIRRSMNLLFRIFGTDLAADPDDDKSGYVKQKEIIEELSKDLTKDLSDPLNYALGSIIAHPQKDQQETLVMWAHAFVGSQIMHLDPMLSEFQRESIKTKKFFLDTDFVLNCIVDKGRFSDVYKKLLCDLVKIGCDLYVTKSVVEEVVKHAEFATRNFYYFRNTFDTIEPSLIEERVKNVFVYDYFMSHYRKPSCSLPENFKEYILNYYDEDEPYEFMMEVLSDGTLPQQVHIADEETETLIASTQYDSNDKERLTDLIYEETNKTAKAIYRTEEENRQIAQTDAELYMTVRSMNSKRKGDGAFLTGNVYLITNTTRSLRCAKQLELSCDVISRPSALVALLAEIGYFEEGNSAIMDLMANPFLANAVNESWDDLKKLADKGVDVREHKLPRLKRDLKDVLHQWISAEDPTNSDEEEGQVQIDKSEFDAFVEMAKEIHARGYKMIPVVENMIEIYNQAIKQNQEKDDVIAKMNEFAKNYGKRKMHYFSKIGKGR